MTDFLHWLPVASRIKYKVLLLVERFQQGLFPKSLSATNFFLTFTERLSYNWLFSAEALGKRDICRGICKCKPVVDTLV